MRFLYLLFCPRDKTIPWWLGPLNFFVLQWFWFRLSVRVDTKTQLRLGWSLVPWVPLKDWIWRIR